jgi:hypothetical protein
VQKLIWEKRRDPDDYGGGLNGVRVARFFPAHGVQCRSLSQQSHLKEKFPLTVGS